MSKKIGALWLKEKDGNKFFSGVLEDLAGDIRIVIFKNDHKEKDNHPDYVILRSEPQEQSPQIKEAEEEESPF